VHVVDLVVVTLAGIAVLFCVGVLARQRFMMRAPGSIPVAMKYARAARWQYGVGRYVGSQLKWYRSLGLGTHASRTLQRRDVEVLSRRSPAESELQSIPATAVVIECQVGEEKLFLALGESAYTGFVSWLESSAPLS